MTPTGFFQKKARRPERFFTLIEMLAAMAVLAILMLMLFMFFNSAQKAWSSTEANTELFENARIAFDLLQRDLQSAEARQNDVPGNDIAFNWSSSSSEAAIHLVAAGADNGELNEIGYTWTNDKTDDNVYTLRRAVLTVTTTSGSGNPYATRTNRPSANYQPVANYVIDFALACTPTGTYNPNTDNKTLPDAVVVQMTLLDKKSFDLWSRLTGTPKTDLATRKARTFSKIIPLGNRQ